MCCARGSPLPPTYEYRAGWARRLLSCFLSTSDADEGNRGSSEGSWELLGEGGRAWSSGTEGENGGCALRPGARARSKHTSSTCCVPEVQL